MMALKKNSYQLKKCSIALNNGINHSHSRKITIESVIGIIRQIRG